MRKVVATFEELIQSYYGGSSDIELRPLSSLDSVISNYYGKSPCKKKANGKSAARVTKDSDDGETLEHRKNGKCAEYVVQRSLSESALSSGEYVVQRRASSAATSFSTGPDSPEQSSATEECRVDVLQSLQQSASPGAIGSSTAAQTFTANAGVSHPLPTPPQAPSTKDKARAGADDFAADLKAILSGQSVYDPRDKTTKPRGKVDRESASPASNGDGGRPSPESANQHEIFDRIAQSMEYANSFDLGTVELQKRLGDFDTFYDLKNKAKNKGMTKATTKAMSAASAPAPAASVPKAGSADFIRDLDAIRSQHSDAQRATGLSEAASVSQYSRPMFDTGEHVLIAADLYEDRLRVGKDPGVLFSYGQIVAMADLYESVDQMMSADPSELQKVKTLIQRSTEYYRTGKRNPKLDVSNKEWNDATGGRFLDLAEDNYEHFSPNFFFANAPFAGSLNQHGNNKSAWESHHRRAIEEAQRTHLAAAPNTSVFPDFALTINAFGDHYLTDAFAAGHIINKEEMIADFKSNFFNGNSLNPQGEQFFEKLARLAFRGEVAKKFSELETVDYPLCAWGWCLKWHPNIDSVSRFHSLLTTAAAEQPDAVANLAVKALHDKLNKDGLEVVNDAGDKSWTITGDGYMNERSRAIIRKAVMQSAKQIDNDPSILASNLNFDLYFDDVWKYVPRPTAASRQRVVALANDYLSPASDRLLNAAAEIITHQLDAMIQKLIREKKLQPA